MCSRPGEDGADRSRPGGNGDVDTGRGIGCDAVPERIEDLHFYRRRDDRILRRGARLDGEGQLRGRAGDCGCGNRRLYTWKSHDLCKYRLRPDSRAERPLNRRLTRHVGIGRVWREHPAVGSRESQRDVGRHCAVTVPYFNPNRIRKRVTSQCGLHVAGNYR